MAVSIAIGSVAAGAAGYLFLTKSGADLRQRISGWFSKNEPDNIDHTAYLKEYHKAPKSDINELLHHGPISGQPPITG